MQESVGLVTDGEGCHEVYVGGRQYATCPSLEEAKRIEKELLEHQAHGGGVDPFDDSVRRRILLMVPRRPQEVPLELVDQVANGGPALPRVSLDPEIAGLQASLGAVHGGVAMMAGMLASLERRLSDLTARVAAVEGVVRPGRDPAISSASGSPSAGSAEA